MYDDQKSNVNKVTIEFISASSYKEKNEISSIVCSQESELLNDPIFDAYIPFTNKMIIEDRNHIGKVQSCVQGNRNTNKLFFNISGDFRYCPKIKRHHKRNSIAIIVDTSNDFFAIRCKDVECDKRSLTWHLMKEGKMNINILHHDYSRSI